MHLWPSTRIRDSFKVSYLKNLEWNLHRMNSEKKSATNRQKLLESEGGGGESVISSNDGKEEVVGRENGSKMSKIVGLCREVVMILSCCYCCFCCGACLDQEEK